MTFAREKRLLLGWLALVAPFPLPFNTILSWPFLLAYMAAITAFLLRARRDPGGWLPTWAMNVLAIAYLPYFVLDLRFLSQGRLMTAVTHLLLFTVLVKLFALRRERDKWQTAMAVFFLFLTSMATSVHPTIVLYLVVFLVLGLLLFTRFAQLHLVAGFSAVPDDGQRLLTAPVGRFLAFAVLATLVLSVPLFAFMPRVRNPLVTGGGQGLGTLGSATGFSEDVDLNTIGNIRTSREVAMRVSYPNGPPPGHEMRFKGGSFDIYEGGSWRQSGRDKLDLRASWGRSLQLGPGTADVWAEVFLRPVTGSAVVVPVDGVVVVEDLPRVAFWLDQGDVVRRFGGRDQPLEYQVGLRSRSGPAGEEDGAEPEAGAPPFESTEEAEAPPWRRGGGLRGAVERRSDGPPPALDTGSVSSRVAELAKRIAGEGPEEEKARRIERYLMTEYDYSLELLGRSLGGDPIEAFLFDHRRGHCEYFASSMVLMLRSVGVPARLAAGFLGGELVRLEGYWVVRQSNAHAWVEAYLPEQGWTVFDPTPASGRPQSSTRGLASLLAEGWDYVVFRWDRYVLTYGFQDQMSFLAGAYGMWRRFLDDFGGGEAEEPAVAGPEGELEEGTTGVGVEVPEPGPEVWSLALVLLLVVGAAVGLALARRARRPLSGIDAYRRLRRSARRAGLPVADADAPLGFARSLERKFPAAGAPGGEVVRLYVRESYGGHALEEGEAGRLKDALGEAVGVLSKAG
jgi:protein-glutamine gamma-glutamyltransferase